MSNHLLEALGVPRAARRRCIEEPDGRSLSHGALWAQAGRMAGVLAAVGVRPGDRVAVQVEKSVAAVALYLGCLRAGAAFVPFNPAYTPPETEHLLADSAPSLFVADPGRPRAGLTLDASGAGTLAAAAAAQPEDFSDVARGADDLASLLYTSGTTGKPKGAMLSHGNLAANARALVEAWRMSETDMLIHALPLFHIHGLFVAVNTVLVAGASMLWRPKFDAAEVLALLPRATLLMGVPTFYTRLLKQPGLNPDVARAMRLFVSGSAPLLAETHRDFAARTGHAILERYGMTETGMNASNPYAGERVPGSVGLPLPGVELRVTADGNPLPTNEIGEIEVRGANVFQGYWRMAGAAGFRPDGFFPTGDLGRIDARGYLHIVGRARDLIISGGLNVYPKEVEDVLDAIAGVEESAVFGAPHPDLGEGVAAAIVPRAGVRVTEDAVIAALTGRLARFKQPKRVLIVAALPRNAMGKVEKAALRRAHAGIFRPN